MPRPLTIALSKGRILDETLPLLAAAGIKPVERPEDTRRLVLPTTRRDTEIVIVRASDVPTYVQHGAAAVGVAGKDILMEHGGAGLYEPLDLGIARCRLVLAGPAERPPVPPRRPRVATKYVRSTRRHFARQGRQVEIIKLYGSMELAPLVGLADWIVDLVDTGATLRANGLAPYEDIAAITSRLIVNRAAMKTRHTELKALIEALAAGVAAPAARRA